MKIPQTALAVLAAALLALVSGCVSADYPGYAGYDSYYYYPDYEVYYYPRIHQFWWRDGGEWRHGDRAPSRFALNDRDRVRIDMDHPPHTDHARVREMFPSHHARNDADNRGAAVRSDGGARGGSTTAGRGDNDRR